MTTHRFFISESQIRGQQIILTGSQARQVYTVLRLRRGDHIEVLDNNGWAYDVEIWTTERDHVLGQIVAREAAGGEPRTTLTLFQSTLKGDKFDWVLQKGTELGVSAFVPIITQRSVLRQTDLKQNKLQRWQKIIAEAAEQSGRGRIPTISQPMEFSQVLAEIQAFDLGLIPWVGEQERSISSLTLKSVWDRPKVGIIIGPEGGFAGEEVEEACQVGVLPISLGQRILRAETAAVVAATLVLHELGDLSPI